MLITSRSRYQCCYGLCCKKGISNAKKQTNCFSRFPSPKTERDKCIRWVAACGRLNFSIADVTKSSQICYTHFEGFQGPTLEHPDPIPLIEVMDTKIINSLVNKSFSEHLGLNLNTIIPQFGGNKSFSEHLGLNLNTLIPQFGWKMQIFEDRVKFKRLRRGSVVLECTITVNNEVLIESLNKRMKLDCICPNFVLNENEDIYALLMKLNKFNICCGNADKDFVDSFTKQSKRKQLKKGIYCDKLRTIFSEACYRLIPAKKKRCYECARYRGCLRKIRSVKILKSAIKPKKKIKVYQAVKV